MIGEEKLDYALNRAIYFIFGVDKDYIELQANLGKFQAEIGGELEEINIMAFLYQDQDKVDLDAVDDIIFKIY